MFEKLIALNCVGVLPILLSNYSPVDLFSSKHEGETVGDAPVASRSRLFGRDRDQDLSVYHPDPYLGVPAGASEQQHRSSHHEPDAGDDDNPFDDDGGYLYASAVRRGSVSTQSSQSPSQIGIGLRQLNTASPLSTRPSPVHSDSQAERLLPLSPSSGVSPYDTYTTNSYADSPSSQVHPLHRLQTSRSSSGGGSPGGHNYYPPPSPSTNSNSHSSVPSMIRNTKAMLALSNPDRDLLEDTGDGPSYVRHADAGPLEDDGPRVARTGETVELPPMYDDLQPSSTRMPTDQRL